MNRIAPSLEEIRDHFNLRAVSTVHEHIEKLKSKGYIKKEMNQARGIRTTLQSNEGENFMEVNILGNIAAGEPIEAIENPEPIWINKELVSPKGQFYALQVKGNSMIDDGIHEGDIVIIEKTAQAENGDTVVAIVKDNEATLKRFYKQSDRIKLQPANPSLKPMYFKKVEIRGKVVALVRKY
jgi:SOS regulatory protein LexA